MRHDHAEETTAVDRGDTQHQDQTARCIKALENDKEDMADIAAAWDTSKAAHTQPVFCSVPQPSSSGTANYFRHTVTAAVNAPNANSFCCTGRRGPSIPIEQAAAQLLTAGLGWVAVRCFRMFKRQQKVLASACAVSNAPHTDELVQAQQQLQDKEAAVKQLEEDLKISKEKARERELTKSEEELKSNTEKLEAAMQELNFATSKCHDASSFLARSMSDLRVTQTELVAARSQLQGAYSDLQSTQDKLADVTGELGLTRSEIELLKRELDRTRKQLNSAEEQMRRYHADARSSMSSAAVTDYAGW
eukprot:353088-Chlamydomonas_euryale.AAC.21